MGSTSPHTPWTTFRYASLATPRGRLLCNHYGTYSYHLTAEDGKSCTGSIDLLQDPEEVKRHASWGWRGAEGEAQVFVVKCSWEGHVHIPVWTTPAFLALMAVGCLYACWRQKATLKTPKARRTGHQQLKSFS